MKTLYISFLSFFLLNVSAGATDCMEKTMRKASKKEIVPPGTVKFRTGLYIDMTELSNFSWLEYMNWMELKHGKISEAYNAILPDTMVWKGTNDNLEEIYLRHPMSHNYPVVGVSYQQALDYCSWRSDRVNEMLFARKNKLEYHFYKADSTFCEIPKICTYRLPTEKEWESFGIAPFSKKVIRKQKNNTIYNVKGNNVPDTENVMTNIKSYWPNSHGQYNIIGNVAEMVAEKGKSKGGSWFHSLEEAAISNSISYSQPTNWLGFRCVCEVKQ